MAVLGRSEVSKPSVGGMELCAVEGGREGTKSRLKSYR